MNENKSEEAAIIKIKNFERKTHFSRHTQSHTITMLLFVVYLLLINVRNRIFNLTLQKSEIVF